MNHTLHVKEVRLSDGSLAYDVLFNRMTIPAISERDAFALADAIAVAIESHSVDSAQVSFGY